MQGDIREPLAKPTTLHLLPRPLLLGEVALRSNDGEVVQRSTLSLEITADRTSGNCFALFQHNGTISGAVRLCFRSDFTPYTTLPYHCPKTILSFGCMLSPVIFSAQSHSTSDLLRTLLMNGCF